MAELADFQTLQRQFAAHIRDPEAAVAPAGIEARRMQVYKDLVYNNIEGFLSGGFPVLRSLYTDDDWQRLVREFITDYRCSSPYFLEISQEFLNFLMQGRALAPADPPCLLELAHYEWVELALDVAAEHIPDKSSDTIADPLAGVPVLSPLVMSLRYSFPVHLIGPGNSPGHAPAEPTYLIVYRNRQERVRFMESNAATARLVELLANNTSDTGQALLEQLAAEMHAEAPEAVVEFGAGMLRQFLDQDILVEIRG